MTGGGVRDLDAVFAALGRSTFRQRFRLGPKERAIVAAKKPETLSAHARRIVAERLAPAHPANDGRQTPMRGHPVFIAQHATATCCRGCLSKWHGIAAGRALSEAEQEHVLAAILRWIAAQPADPPARASASARQLKLDV